MTSTIAAEAFAETKTWRRVSIALAVLAAVLVMSMSGCDSMSPVLTDTRPDFQGTVADQTYTVGEAISSVPLPAATGGDGALSYTLQPRVPGLTFDPQERTLSGTPTTAGTFSVTYRVEDADENTTDDDAAIQAFTITVRERDTAPITDLVSSVAVDDAVGVLRLEELPAPTGGPAVSVSGNDTVINGGSFFLSIASESGGALEKLLISLDGESFGYYEIYLSDVTRPDSFAGKLQSRLQSASANQGSSYQLRGDIAQDLIADTFSLLVMGADASGIGPPYRANYEVIEVGSGDVQVSLSWNIDSDVDLHVVDPNGHEIYYGRPSVLSGGQLDLDSNPSCNIDGIRNENIRWPAGRAPRGTYIVRVDYYDSCEVSATDYAVRLSYEGKQETFSGSLTGPGDRGGAGSGRYVATFRLWENPTGGGIRGWDVKGCGLYRARRYTSTRRGATTCGR